MRGIHRWSMNSPHKSPVTRKMFPFDDVIMLADDTGLIYFACLSIHWVRYLFFLWLCKPSKMLFIILPLVLGIPKSHLVETISTWPKILDRKWTQALILKLSSDEQLPKISWSWFNNEVFSVRKFPSMVKTDIMSYHINENTLDSDNRGLKLRTGV